MRGPTLSRWFRLLLLLLVGNLWLLAGCSSQETQQLNIGDPAPNFTAETQDGSSISLSDYKDKQPVLLFFHMAGGWPPCLQQIVDLQDDEAFQQTGVTLISIAFDSKAEQHQVAQDYGISVPMVIDADHRISEAYDVLKWAVASGEPGHTFVLVDANGKVAWIRDYGAAENGGSMYVPVDELVQQISASLQWHEDNQ